MASLYINSKGYEVRSHSYSGGSLFKDCARRYKLTRLDGWAERERRASQEFGIAIENAIQAYHIAGFNLDMALETFRNYWAGQKDRELTYTQTEQNWDALNLSGQELIRLYDIRLPLFPIDLSVLPQFQVKYYKELFPGTDLAGIEFVAFIDMVTRSKTSLGDSLIVDIKTSGVSLDSTPGILALDQQLRTYAWVTGVSEVAFLWFQKTGRGIERGTCVTLLEPVGELKPGQNVFIIKYSEFKPARAADPFNKRIKEKAEEPEEIWAVRHSDIIEKMFEECGDGQTKDEKDARQEFILKNATKLEWGQFTRQRVEFKTATIGLREQAEAAQVIGQEVAQIVHANEENYWPLQGGVRWPNDKCVRCPMRGICLGDGELRDRLVHRVDSNFETEQEND